MFSQVDIDYSKIKMSIYIVFSSGKYHGVSSLQYIIGFMSNYYFILFLI